MRKPTRQENVVLQCIKKYIDTNGYSPTRREISAMTGLSGFNVNFAIKGLVGKNLVKVRPRCPRAISLIGYKLVKE